MRKFFNATVWALVTFFFGVWYLIAAIGQPYMIQNASSINGALGIDPYVTVGETKERLYESDYLTKNSEDKDVFDDKAMRAASMAVAEEAATDGIVMLWNKGNALPLAKSSRITLFGIGSVNYKYSGGGSGEIKSAPELNLRGEMEAAGYSVNPNVYNAYASLRNEYGASNAQGKQTLDPNYNGTNGYVDERYREFYVNEVPWDTLNATVKNGVVSTLQDGRFGKGYGDAAVMIITRDGCEDGDTWFNSKECIDGNYLDLAFEEVKVLEQLKTLKDEGTVKKIVVVLNCASVFQMKNITLEKYGIDACLYAGAGGVTSIKAIANVISGKANPSGRLVDLFPYDVDSAPAVTNFGDFRWTSEKHGLPTDIGTYSNSYVVYQEGIYVGYRYYETRYEDSVLGKGNSGSWKYSDDVAYPFGYGLSYSTFEESDFKVTHKDGGFGGTYTVEVKVTNTGSVAGKHAVGIYLQKPYTAYDIANKVEKAAIELVGLAKTKILEPGKSETLTVEVNGADFKTYDTYGAGTYILEKGDYYLATGSDAHDALNNVLAAKGVTSGLVDSLGNAETNATDTLTHRVTISEDDFTTYAKSEYTEYEVQNQLSDGDLNLYEGTADQKITYLTRNNWTGTYPTAAVKLACTNAIMTADMQYSHGEIDATGYEMPTMGTVTIEESWFEEHEIELAEDQEKRLTLVMLTDLDYNDEAWTHLLNQLTWTEMNHMLSGGYLKMNGATSVGDPGAQAADGTSGVRVNNPTTGTLMGFPTQTVLAQTWDLELIERVGIAFGHECMHSGVTQLYAPGANMHRAAYGGRNWEYFSEDPFLSGKMLAAEVKGLQSKGVIVCAKHFAFNDQEINRCGVATFLNEQTAREIYLKVFELGVTEGGAKSLMSSFPRLGCRWVGNYSGLMTDILRKEWGFLGFVETDSAFDQKYMTYVSNSSSGSARAEGVVAGVDFWMDGGAWEQFGNVKNNARVVNAVRESCHRVLYAKLNSLAINGLSTKTQVEYVTPWWEEAIGTAKFAFGAITAVFGAFTVISLIVNIGKKKEY